MATEWTRAMVRPSKFLSLVLRHAPERAGLELDPAGWADVDALLAGTARAGLPLTRAQLEAIVAHNPKRRFTFDASGTRIRAVQGHSVDVDLGYARAIPPHVLFHGTHAAALDAILARGLHPMGRRHVHLSEDEATARGVGARRGPPRVLRVNAGAMHAEGAPFWRADNGVWLCRAVPARHLATLVQ